MGNLVDLLVNFSECEQLQTRSAPTKDRTVLSSSDACKSCLLQMDRIAEWLGDEEYTFVRSRFMEQLSKVRSEMSSGTHSLKNAARAQYGILKKANDSKDEEGGPELAVRNYMLSLAKGRCSTCLSYWSMTAAYGYVLVL